MATQAIQFPLSPHSSAHMQHNIFSMAPPTRESLYQAQLAPVTLHISAQDVLNEKLRKRSKLDLKLANECPDALAISTFVFPAHLPMCGHIVEFADLCPNLICPNCLKAVRISDVRVFKQSDFKQKTTTSPILQIEAKIEELSQVDLAVTSKFPKLENPFIPNHHYISPKVTDIF